MLTIMFYVFVFFYKKIVALTSKKTLKFCNVLIEKFIHFKLYMGSVRHIAPVIGNLECIRSKWAPQVPPLPPNIILCNKMVELAVLHNMGTQ
jgi:hypothetical protein